MPHPAGRGKETKGSQFFWIFLLLSLNLLLMGGVICFLILKKPQTTVAAPVPQPPQPQPQVIQPQPAPQPEAPAAPAGEDDIDPSQLLQHVTFTQATSEALEKSASLPAAERLYEDGEYFKACYMYDQLRKNLFSHNAEQQSLRDYLNLKMALCLQKTQEQDLMAGLFTKALRSPFPTVRAMASYNLAFLELHNGHYLSARTHAYQTLAFLKAFEERMPAGMEADCTFLAAESLTSYILKLHDQTQPLPGQGWSDTTKIWGVPVVEQRELQEFLMLGFDEIAKASVVPVISRDPQRQSGAQWNAICRDAPLEEILWKFSSSAEMNLEWAQVDLRVRRRPVSLYLPSSAGATVAEVAAGSAGLLWRFDGEKALLYDPEQYTDFGDHKLVLIREAISTWQRFLLKHRGDERSANAHYLLGMLYALEGQTTTAMGEYKLLVSQYPEHPLAPFALLNSSKIKTNLLDFEGARADLQELLIQYPECKVMDEASLYLAEAAAGSGDYVQAERMFRKVYQINMTEGIRCRAAYGVGQCAYARKDYKATAEWLGKAIQMIKDPQDTRLAPACFRLGQALIELGEYAKGAAALRMALGGQLAAEEYVEITLELVRAEMKQERFVQALQLIESIPERGLSQEQSCDMLLTRAQLLQEIDLVESAVSLLRRRIEYIAEASIRARLALELANCYAQEGDWRIAEQELREVLYDLENPREIQRAFALLAEITYRQGKVDMALDICKATLKEYPQASEDKRKLQDLLGTIYKERQDYKSAAQAYAGLLNASEAETHD